MGGSEHRNTAKKIDKYRNTAKKIDKYRNIAKKNRQIPQVRNTLSKIDRTPKPLLKFCADTRLDLVFRMLRQVKFVLAKRISTITSSRLLAYNLLFHFSDVKEGTAMFRFQTQC